MLSLNNRQRTDIVKDFCKEIEKSGYYAIVYCNHHFIKEKLLPKYDFYLAQLWAHLVFRAEYGKNLTKKLLVILVEMLILVLIIKTIHRLLRVKF